jgi:8-oxo-dGTP diphosphatase
MPPVLEVTAAIIEMDGRILAARRRTRSGAAGLWEFPGGKLEANESPEECLVRELEEELGIRTEVIGAFGVSTHDEGHRLIRLLAYRVRHLSGDFTPHVHSELRWLTIAELHSVEWMPADIALIKLLQTQTKVF